MPPPGDKAIMLRYTTDRMRSRFYEHGHHSSAASARRASHKDWPRISQGSPFIYVDPPSRCDGPLSIHANDAQSAILLRKLRGELQRQRPILDLINGGVANKDVVKESVPNGTYIRSDGILRVLKPRAM